MKKTIAWILLGIMICTVPVYAERFIVGGGMIFGAVPAPSGVCTLSFNMLQDGTVTFPESTITLWSGIGALENAFNGYGYAYSMSAANVAKLYQFDLSTMVLTGLAPVVDNAGVPDAVNSQQSSRYNTFLQKWVNSGLTGGVIHVRLYTGGGLTSDINTGLAVTSLNSTSGYNANFTFWSVTQGGNNWLYVANTGTYTLAQSVNVGGTPLGGVSIVSDANFIYGGINPNVIRRFDITNVAVNTAFPIVGLTSVTGMVEAGGFLYVTGVSGGNGIIHKINTSTMASVANVVFGAIQLGSPMIDSVNSKIYIPSRSGGNTSQLIRMGLNSFAVEQTYNGLVSTNGPNTTYATLDVERQWAFMESLGGGGFQSRIERVNLCT